jgi:hypothetical protein
VRLRFFFCYTVTGKLGNSAGAPPPEAMAIMQFMYVVIGFFMVVGHDIERPGGRILAPLQAPDVFNGGGRLELPAISLWHGTGRVHVRRVNAGICARWLRAAGAGELN